jgi:hypothetical protein
MVIGTKNLFKAVYKGFGYTNINQIQYIVWRIQSFHIFYANSPYTTHILNLKYVSSKFTKTNLSLIYMNSFVC